MFFTKIKSWFMVMKSVAFVTYKEWAAYRSHMLVSLFIGPVFLLTQIFIWRAVYSTQDVINGLTLNQMITYYGIATIINYLIMDFADWNLQMLISTGKFITYIIRPMSHGYFALSQKVGHRILGFWVEFIPVYIILWFFFEVKLVPVMPFWTVVSLILGFIMMFLINYTIGMSAFWLTRTDGIRGVFLLVRDVFAGFYIPLNFFPLFVQKILFFMPFQFITYVPIRVFLGSYQLAGKSISIPFIVLIQGLSVLAMYLLSRFVWKLGIRKFTGVGA